MMEYYEDCELCLTRLWPRTDRDDNAGWSRQDKTTSIPWTINDLVLQFDRRICFLYPVPDALKGDQGRSRLRY